MGNADHKIHLKIVFQPLFPLVSMLSCILMANKAGQRTNTLGRAIMAAARQTPVIQGEHFVSTERKASAQNATVTTWLKKLDPLLIDSHK
jgi:hypothetical protein